MTGKDLKNRLELTGVPFRQIAELLGISEQNLQNKMSSADIKVSFLFKIAKVLNKSIYFFLEGQGFYEENIEIRHHNTIPSPPIQSITSASTDNSIYKILYDREREKNTELSMEVGRFKGKLEVKDKESDELIKRIEFLEKELAKSTEDKIFIEETVVSSPSKTATIPKQTIDSADARLGRKRT